MTLTQNQLELLRTYSDPNYKSKSSGIQRRLQEIENDVWNGRYQKSFIKPQFNNSREDLELSHIYGKSPLTSIPKENAKKLNEKLLAEEIQDTRIAAGFYKWSPIEDEKKAKVVPLKDYICNLPKPKSFQDFYMESQNGNGILIRDIKGGGIFFYTQKGKLEQYLE